MKLLSQFGREYEKEISITHSDAWLMLNSLCYWELLKGMIEIYPNYSNYRTLAVFNLESEQITYNNLRSDEDFIESHHLIIIASIRPEIENCLTEEDFLEDWELRLCNRYDVSPWDYIHRLKDYDDRLMQSLEFYQDCDTAWVSRFDQIDDFFYDDYKKAS